ncbi:uncharacterized protein LOC123712042 isoform X2 [Pieris brassicae]|uniref:uncharacterized protein LOC123712042 isoform X2 n=1 Tax=Pieris brassicae TaxID=7116 RepID=UPI001E660739|nr:uncharacterized protein LOC123712042 isoform X2 [Pieris brassicae]
MLPMLQTETLLFNSVTRSDGAPPAATLPPSMTPDSEVEELVDIFFDIDVAVNTFSRVESCDLQAGDTWRGVQGKMSVTAPGKKIRKKSGNQPQSQINKCFNEKRRRELENEVINQLEELLHTCLAEVRQPDKNGIVREATRQISEVLSRRQACPSDCPLRSAPARSPLQAGEVSSTQQPPPHHYTEISTLIEAVKHYTSVLGLILMEINSKGEIECVTENIKELILVERTELYKKSIFSLLHTEDHAKLRPLLRNIQTFTWGPTDPEKYQNIQARFLVKDSTATDGSRLAECVIHAAAVRASPAEEAGSVMCVIRRCDPAAPAPPRPALVFRLDCTFTILSCDLSGVENCISSTLSLVGTRYLELVDSGDRARVSAHLQEVVCRGGGLLVSEPYALRLGADGPRFRVSAQSRLFPTAGEPDFIMSTNTVVGDDDDILESTRPPLGGPLMTSIVNGDPSAPPRYRSPVVPTPEPESQFSMNDFDLDPWGSTFAISEVSGEDSKERKEPTGEDAGAPLTPRAPSTPGEGPPTPRTPPTPLTPHPAPLPEKPNRLRTLLSSKKTNDPILKDLLNQKDEEGGGGDSSGPHTPHTPLTPHTPHTPASALSPLHSAQPQQRHPQQLHSHQPPTSHAAQHPTHHNNQMLKLLNDKSDEDGDDRNRSSSALLSQLLAGGPGGGSSSSGGNGGRHENELYLERIAGIKRKFDESKATAANPKRATPEHQQVTSSAAGSSTSSSLGSPASVGKSELCLKNQILVSLLARQQTTPPTPLPLHPVRAFPPRQRPPHPAHAPRQHPHTLSNMLAANNRGGNMNGGVGSAGGETGSAQSHLQLVLQGARGAYPPPPSHPSPLHYAAPAPHHGYNAQPPGGSTRVQGGGNGNDIEVHSDKTLSEILDELIENNERNSAPDHTLMDLDTRAASHDYQGVNEKKAAINAITQSLMQCESVSKSPVPSSGAQSTAPPVYPSQSPSGPGAALYGAARARAFVEQHRARLLHLQESQQMLVSPEAAEQPQQDLGSTINALVSATPPNVTLLPRADFHHLYHPTSQMGSSYGTNKIVTSQQSPMLSRQLHGGGAYGPSVSGVSTALHTPLTPLTPQPYHRAPRPHHVGGYYEDGDYCGDFGRRAPPAPPLAPHPSPHDHMPYMAGGAGAGPAGGGTSEYVRNELRAVVGARSARPEMHAQELDPLLAFDMPAPGGGGSGGRGAANAWKAPQSTPSTTEAGSAAGGDEAPASKASLLQKLLSQ